MREKKGILTVQQIKRSLCAKYYEGIKIVENRRRLVLCHLAILVRNTVQIRFFFSAEKNLRIE
jgi:hypothetical protein